ncbi:MAG: hypothetical protein EPO35_12750 [Acidobacteria bacterium]|nr:MAG: hypothetical protein EPO35_12750 [Acidobacteriota bacterium]
MKLERIISVVIGAAAFGFAHGLITGESLRATFTPDPLIRPWFTNSTGSVAFTAALVAIAGFAYALAAADRRGAMTRGVTVGVGAIAAMLAVMVRFGIGNLGPIVFAVGGAILLAAGTAGGGLAATMKRA